VLLTAGTGLAYELIESFNVEQPPPSGMIYAYPANFAFRYLPAQDYMLYKIEMYAAGSEYFEDDAITLQVQTESSGEPSGDVLATVNTPVEDGDPYWAGSDFPAPVEMTEGDPYWIIYFPMPWSPIGWAADGDHYFESMFSADQIHWDPIDPIAWKVKFWGELIVANEGATWSDVKSLYR
jgi:hypothetical protein